MADEENIKGNEDIIGGVNIQPLVDWRVVSETFAFYMATDYGFRKDYVSELIFTYFRI